jgi:hypothetical protein
MSTPQERNTNNIVHIPLVSRFELVTSHSGLVTLSPATCDWMADVMKLPSSLDLGQNLRDDLGVAGRGNVSRRQETLSGVITAFIP